LRLIAGHGLAREVAGLHDLGDFGRALGAENLDDVLLTYVTQRLLS
jgi:hypothetical protein